MEKKEHEAELQETDKVYDSVFWTEINMFTQFLPYLVNEVFGEHFTEKAKVEFRPNKQITETNDGKMFHNEVDALFTLTEMQDRLVRKSYHYEFEAKGTKDVAIRIARYASAHAYASVRRTRYGATMEIPYSAFVFLRSDSANINKLKISINYPGGSVFYYAPVIKIKDYTLEELFEKKLLILVPFYVFKITEREYDKMEKEYEKLENSNVPYDKGDGIVDKIRYMIDNISNRLQELVDNDEISDFEKADIMDHTMRVLDKLLGKREKVREGVKKNMGGYIIETVYDKMHKTIVEQQNALVEKDTAIAEQQNALVEKDTAIAEQQNAIAEKDSEIALLRKEIEELKKNNQVIGTECPT
ncbi:MAG: hypothetical protein IKW90_08065 [Lachnospiraceae bacterium]|nr:hypothetical protein [Lachnospiraceae bacterium]